MIVFFAKVEMYLKINYYWFLCWFITNFERPIFLEKNKFDYISDVCDLLGSRADVYGLKSLIHWEQVALMAWWAKGIIDNGGFQYFYEGAWQSEEVAAAFDELGFSQAAWACRESMTVFPLRQPQEVHALRRQWIE